MLRSPRWARAAILVGVLASSSSTNAHALYIQVADSGHVVAYTWANFLTGNNGDILSQVNGYANDAGFLSVPDVPEPSTAVLLAAGLAGACAWCRRRAE